MMRLRYKCSLELARCKKIIKNYNVFCACFLLAKKMLTTVSGFCIALCIVFIRPFVKIYLVRLNSSRLGHFALSTEVMLSEFEMNPGKKKGKVLLFYLRLSAANKQLLKMYQRSMYVLSFPRLYHGIDTWLHRLLGRKYGDDFVKSFEVNEAMHAVNDTFRKTRPYFFFTEKELEHGKNVMAKLGLPPDAKFVCLLARDHAYMTIEHPGDHAHHTVRNANIQTYQEAALYLAEKGYYVLRMGKHVEQPFEAQHPYLIDYAKHPLRSDFMDIYLSAHCYFFISTGSGLDIIPQLFRRPVLLTNIVFPWELQPWYPCYFFIPKKIRSRATNKLLTYKEMCDLALSHSAASNALEVNNLELIANTPGEILKLVEEMEIYLSHEWSDDNFNDTLQEKFQSICSMQKMPVPCASNWRIKIGEEYLKTNLELLNLS